MPRKPTRTREEIEQAALQLYLATLMPVTAAEVGQRLGCSYAVAQPHLEASTRIQGTQGMREVKGVSAYGTRSNVRQVVKVYAPSKQWLGEQLRAARASQAGWFVTTPDGHTYCQTCKPADGDIFSASVTVWEHGSHGWLAPPCCDCCKVDFPVYCDGNATTTGSTADE